MRNDSRLLEMLVRHEGVRLSPYRDSVGKLTIGIGRNLDDRGITESEALMMAKYDIEVVRLPLLRHKWFTLLCDVRKDVIIDMAFNMGLPRFMKFKRMIEALKDQDYLTAALEMIESKWAKQVGLRAVELAYMMQTGKYDSTKYA